MPIDRIVGGWMCSGCGAKFTKDMWNHKCAVNGPDNNNNNNDDPFAKSVKLIPVGAAIVVVEEDASHKTYGIEELTVPDKSPVTSGPGPGPSTVVPHIFETRCSFPTTSGIDCRRTALYLVHIVESPLDPYEPGEWPWMPVCSVHNGIMLGRWRKELNYPCCSVRYGQKLLCALTGATWAIPDDR